MHADAGVGSRARAARMPTQKAPWTHIYIYISIDVFVSLAWSPSSASFGGGDRGVAPSCFISGVHVERDLISFHVFAFVAFLALSPTSLVRPHGHRGIRTTHVNKGLLRAKVVASSSGLMFG
ncbi:hypothetical protein Cni_G10858 [Canna indica]|uniref:Uncharacterized protein n=1 Tax=Canna indica TaxID=4628 RepID=A0AAQ3K5E9_9LILI|nr:hypothetical protein Cni_G10858 [Canna indica]